MPSSVSLSRLFACVAVVFFAASAFGEDWISLFNGKDLEGWTPKIRGYALGENFADTFRVEDGLITVSYDGYDSFDNKFGHLFYKTPYSYYRILVEYRFIGEHTKGGPGWAFRNSGVMLHCQPRRRWALTRTFRCRLRRSYWAATARMSGRRATCVRRARISK